MIFYSPFDLICALRQPSICTVKMNSMSSEVQNQENISFISNLLKPLQNKKGQKYLGYLTKKQSFYKEKRLLFCFEAALV
jgi:hypothetical protein